MEKRISTPIGNLILIAKDGRLVYCNWEEKDCLNKYKKIISSLGNSEAGKGPEEKDTQGNGNETTKDQAVIDSAIAQLKEYFEGKRTRFSIPMKLTGTEFQKQVWEIMFDNISYGQTLSYRDLSTLCGRNKAARAVARACGSNPLAIFIPCHRVVASGGESGGYTGGKEKKLFLLNLERDNLKSLY